AWGELAMKGKICAAACGLLGTVLVVAAPSAVRAEDDDVPFDQKIIKNVLGTIGLSGGADINYRERSPLVLPPKIDLPPPQKDATAGAPNWPVDAEAKQRKEESNRRRDEVEESRPLRPDELNVGPRQNTRTGLGDDHPDGAPMSQSKLGYKGGLFGSLFNWKKDEAVQFNGEPPRTSLIEPPTGYQTPSPEQPYGPSTRRDKQKAQSFFDFRAMRK